MKDKEIEAPRMRRWMRKMQASEPKGSRRLRNGTLWETEKSKRKMDQVFIKVLGLHMACEKGERICNSKGE